MTNAEDALAMRLPAVQLEEAVYGKILEEEIALHFCFGPLLGVLFMLTNSTVRAALGRMAC